MPFFSRVTSGATRLADAWGSGQYGAGRGARTHHGLDVVAFPGEAVSSPIGGSVVREAHPYADDPTFRGVVIRGTRVWEGYEVKLFYVEGLFAGDTRAGQVIGRAQAARDVRGLFLTFRVSAA